jgi:small subunit ribosomal protein S6
MHKYKIGYIIKPNTEKAVSQKINATINDLLVAKGADILSYKEDGLKDLAYEIQTFSKGYYVWLEVLANNAAIEEFNRVIGITEEVIRYIVVNTDDK